MSITVGHGIIIGPGNSLRPVDSHVPVYDQIIGIDAGDSKCFSGSGIAYYGVPGGIGAHDLSGHNNVAQFTNGVTWVNQGDASYFNFAAGTDQYLDCNAVNPTPLAAGNYTYFAMVRFKSFENRIVISSNQTSLYFEATGGHNNGPRLVASNNNGTPNIIDNTSEFLPDTWYGIAVGYSGSNGTMKLFVNGVNTIITLGAPTINSDQSIWIGNYQNQTTTEDGHIAVALVYSSFLDDRSIKAIYEYYSPFYAPVITTSSAFYGMPGSYTWVCPPGVTSVSVLAIGAGGGGTQEPYSPPGGDSFFVDSNTCWAQGGPEVTDSIYSGPPAQFVGDGGGLGGVINPDNSWGIGGGGAGGYSGQGGTGSLWESPGGMTAGAGGAGGGGGGRFVDTGGGGGGSGIYGQGADGAAGTFDSVGNQTTTALGGFGGSGGQNGGEATSWNGGRGGLYGGGGGSASEFYLGGNGGALAWINNYSVVPGESYAVQVGAGGEGRNDGGSGAPGCVRIVWPGNLRQFPSTDVGPDN